MIYSYNLIAKVETSSEDTACIFEKVGFNSLSSSPEHQQQHLLFRADERIHVTTVGGSSSSESLAEELFQTLTKEQVRKLYELYKMDFLAFGYSPETFENLAAPRSSSQAKMS